MRWRYWLLGFVVLACCRTGLAQDTPVDLARRASGLYEQGDFHAARDLYETIVSQGVHDGVIYFNLGQTYVQLQDLGRALLSFRRAQKLAPRDTNLREAMARVRAQRIEIQGDETALPDGLAALTSGFLTFDELNGVVLALWMLFCAGAGMYFLREDWRSNLRAPMLLLTMLLAISLVLWGSRTYSTSARPGAVVIATSAPVMSGPGDDYLEIYQLHAAAELRILAAQGDWLHFVLPDERQGWIQRTAVEEI